MTHNVTIAASGLKVGKRIEQGKITKIQRKRSAIYVTVDARPFSPFVLRPDQPVTVIK